MDPSKFLTRNIVDVLLDLRATHEIVEYKKIAGDEFIILKEDGVFLHAEEQSGIIFKYAIYFKPVDNYFVAQDDARGEFAGLNCSEDLIRRYGQPTFCVESITIGSKVIPPAMRYNRADGYFSASLTPSGDIISISVSHALA